MLPLIVIFIISILFWNQILPEAPKTEIVHDQVEAQAKDDNKSQNDDLKSRLVMFQMTNELIKESAPKDEIQRESVLVKRVIDGDTIELADGRKLRYIGINTPETVDPKRAVECFGKEASQMNKLLVEGKTVTLEKDVSETDRYGRLLRYVYLDGQMINELLVKAGYAQASAYPPDVKYQERFLAAEKTALKNKMGLWGDLCLTQEAIKPKTSPSVSPVSKETQKKSHDEGAHSGCQYDCQGPDQDCKDFSTHNQAQSFFECCGFSAANDPMKLDSARGDGNGLACESLP